MAALGITDFVESVTGLGYIPALLLTAVTSIGVGIAAVFLFR
jgi:hypothetical protein